MVGWLVYDNIGFVGSLDGLGNKCANVDMVSLDVVSGQYWSFHGVYDMRQRYKFNYQ